MEAEERRRLNDRLFNLALLVLGIIADYPCRTYCVRPVCAAMFGGADRDRTDDLRLAKPALSQLSYSPVSLIPSPF